MMLIILMINFRGTKFNSKNIFDLDCCIYRVALVLTVELMQKSCLIVIVALNK